MFSYEYRVTDGGKVVDYYTVKFKEEWKDALEKKGILKLQWHKVSVQWEEGLMALSNGSDVHSLISFQVIL